MSPNFTLSPQVQTTLARSSAEMHQAATFDAKALFSLNAVAAQRGAPLFAGIPASEKARRRAAGKRQRAARKITRKAA